MKDPVVFRVWPEGDVFTLFPTIHADNYGRYCSSYQHIGQHGAADYDHCIKYSRPATEAEAAPLLRELEGRGYKLQPIARASRQHHEARRAEAMRLRCA